MELNKAKAKHQERAQMSASDSTSPFPSSSSPSSPSSSSSSGSSSSIPQSPPPSRSPASAPSSPTSLPPPSPTTPPQQQQQQGEGQEQNEEKEKMKRLRQKVVEELVLSEKSYVKDLHTILSLYYVPMLEVLGPREMQSIFSNMEQIISVNTTFFAELQQVAQLNIQDQKIGQVFISMADFFKVYITFCCNQSESIETVHLLQKKNKSFQKILNEADNSDLVRGLNFNSFMSKPFQRICKYPLLLRELLRYTPPEHPDYQGISSAMAKVEAVVADVNKGKKNLENQVKLLQIQQSLMGSNLVLAQPTRRFVCEEYVNVYKEKKMTKHKIFLFNDLVVWGTETLSLDQTFSEMKCIYLCKGSTDILLVLSVETVPEANIKNGLELIISGLRKPLILIFESAEKRASFATALKNCITLCKTLRPAPK
eukprot:TRINITY_DN1392_c0_g2_i1.p1 TRINITY_DN1392_c0_g2~~TRINITY_DN1392_c0_g2_i1.p1  ORF type:complete len:425 (+),score=136.55 TRINITY_DN1392_c0_g2_i1:192-1466(+)